MDIFKIVLGRQLGGREKRCECWQWHYKYERKGRRECGKWERKRRCDGGDETKSSKVVKGLGEDRRVIGVALAAVCNILTDFSLLRPVRLFFPFFAFLPGQLTTFNYQIYLEEKLMPRLIYIMKESGDPSLRLSTLWAVKTYCARQVRRRKRM